MICKNCKNELKRGWKFCPFCGESTSLFRFRSKNFSEKNIEKEMEHMLESFGMPGIKIRFQTHSGPLQEKRRIEKRTVKPSYRNVETVEEPEVKIKQKANETQIDVVVPDVKSINDVFVKRLEESLEIRAYSGKKMYFKVVPVPKSSRILKQILEKHVLTLVLGR